MAVTPLNTAQRTAVKSLVDARRLSTVPPDSKRATSFLAHASDALEELPNLSKASIRYTLAYDACHDVGEALMAAYGFRTASGQGQHEALGRFLRAVLINPPGDGAARRFDQLRRSRNQQRYEAAPVGGAQADLAVATASALFAAALDRGLST